MQEFNNGTFGEIKPAKDLIDEMQIALAEDPNSLNELKALHIGTESELQEVKTRKKLEGRVEALEEMVIEAPPESDIIIIPQFVRPAGKSFYLDAQDKFHKEKTIVRPRPLGYRRRR